MSEEIEHQPAEKGRSVQPSYSSTNLNNIKKNAGSPAAFNSEVSKRVIGKTKGSKGFAVPHPAPPPLPSGQVAAQPKEIKNLRTRRSFRQANNPKNNRSVNMSAPNNIPRVNKSETVPPKTEYLPYEEKAKVVTNIANVRSPAKKRDKNLKGVLSRAAMFEGMGMMGAGRKPRKKNIEVRKLRRNLNNFPVMGMRAPSKGRAKDRIEEEEKKYFENETKVDVTQMLVNRARIEGVKSKRRRRRRKKKIRRSREEDL